MKGLVDSKLMPPYLLTARLTGIPPRYQRKLAKTANCGVLRPIKHRARHPGRRSDLGTLVRQTTTANTRLGA